MKKLVALMALALLVLSACLTPTPTSTPQEATSFRAEPVLEGLDFPTSFAFAPDGRLFFIERFTGRVRVVQEGKLLPEPWAELEVVKGAETGLLGLALHPNFDRKPYLYLYYTYQADDGKIYNRVARFKEKQGKGEEMTVLLDHIPAAQIHNGGILKFGADGKLYISTGDATIPHNAQKLDSLSGKILRLNPDGSIPQDNPFPDSPVFSLGHRNVFGLAFHPETGTLVITENGPTTDDEINVIHPGGNYGWPLVLGVAGQKPFIDPVLTFTPNIAPTQAEFYSGDKLPPTYQGNLFFGAWNTGSIYRVILSQDLSQVLLYEAVFTSPRGGIVGLGMGADGYLYFSTPNAIYRLISAA